MHDNIAGEVSDPGLDSAVAVAIQVALVGTLFMLAISGTATIVFNLATVM